MRIPDQYIPPFPIWSALLVFIILAAICIPGLKREIGKNYALCVGLILLGAAGNWFQWRLPGSAWFSLTALPVAVLMVGWRFAMALNLVGAVAWALFYGIGNAFGVNMLINAIIVAFVAICFPGYSKRLRGKLRGLALFLTCWISITACALLISFVIPLFGLALWGIFGRTLAFSSLWSAIIIALFTVIAEPMLRRYAAAPRKA